MNQNDREIFKLLKDMKNIERSMSSTSSVVYPEIKDLYTKSLNLFNKKAYSDINVQDEEGNTFFHYVIDAKRVDLAKTIISRSGNPLIKNKKRENGFCLYGSKTRASLFLNEYKEIYLDENFNNKTKGFCLEFKQLIFDWKFKTPNSLKDIIEIKKYLTSVDLNTPINRLKLLQYAIFLNYDEKLTIYENNFDTKKLNSSFLKYLTGCSDNLKSMVNISDSFYERNFQDNNDFESALSSVVYQADYAKNKSYSIKVAQKLIKIMLNQNFNLNKTINFKESIENQFLNHEILGKIYLNEKFNFNLTNKIENNKQFKI